MVRSNISSVLRYIRGLAAENLGSLPDSQLLQRFTGEQEEAAFATLLQRHGPMVLSVCRRVLRQTQDAEDAFQATFLLLARSAEGIRNPDAVGGWLHSVALRVSSKLRSKSARQSATTKAATPTETPPTTSEPASSDPTEQATWKELRVMLDEELDRLPSELRMPLILCYLEGRTQDEGARQLGWGERIFRRRLEKGRARLARQLARRGVTLSTAMFALLLSQEAPAMTPALWAPALQAATAIAAGRAGGGVSATAWGLAEGFGPSLVSSKGKVWLALLLTVNLAATGVGIFVATRSAEHPPSASTEQAPQEQPPQEAVETTAPAGVELVGMTAVLNGRVVDASGHPVPFAQLAVLARRPYRPGEHGLRQDVLRQGEADADGNFRIVVPADFPTWYAERQVVLAAGATGHAPGTLAVPLRAGQANLTVNLAPSRPLRGRVVDRDAKPAVGVRLEVVRLGSALREIVQTTEAGRKENESRARLDNLDLWPAPAITNAAGEFEFPSLGTVRNVWLQVQDDRYTVQTFPAEFSDGRPIDGKPYGFMVMAGQVLQGTVTAADTGKPIPYARLTAVSPNEWTDAPRHSLHTVGREVPRAARGLPTSLYWTPWLHTVAQEAGPRAPCSEFDARADAAGRFRLRVPSGRFFRLEAHAPPGTPYLALSRVIDRKERDDLRLLNFALPRGVLVTARIREAETGQPVPRAVAYYIPDQDNAHARGEILYACDAHAVSGSDGRLRLAVPAGRGRLCIHAPNGDFVPVPYRFNKLATDRVSYANAICDLDLEADRTTVELNVPLRKGVSITGKVVGPDGRPVNTAIMVTAQHVHPLNPATARPMPVTGGEFVLPGCEAGRTYQVLFLDADRRLGAAVDLTAGQPAPVVQLQSCGQATARFVDNYGRPMRNQILTPFALLEPDVAAGDEAARAAKAVPHEIAWADPMVYHHCLGPHTEADGCITLTGLIPGVRYGMTQWDGVYHRVTDLFTVRPGEALRLPDVTPFVPVENGTGNR
jgi:RNA polymerase sigma factor (sigma-70 family)